MANRKECLERRAGHDDAGRRLDRVLRAFLGELPLSAIYKSLRQRLIRVNGKAADGSYLVEEGDILSFDPGLVRGLAGGRGSIEGDAPKPRAGLESLGELLMLATEDLLFLNKPKGLLVHGPGSLEERVRAALSERSEASLSFTPGPLHRLDRNTSGIVTFPRSSAGARAFTSLLRGRRIRKLYIALLEGNLGSEALWTDRISRDRELRLSSVMAEGASASSLARPLLVGNGYSLALVELQTGLTHQIRVQAASRAHPLAGDSKYGGRPFAGGYILHALALGFPEPPFPDLPPRIVAPLPRSARGAIGRLFGAERVEEALESALFS
jgi:23S rRNA pseudouridine955/2504/2580 synthase